MASLFPGGLDEFTNPTPSDTLDSATVPHAAQHANINNAVEAVEETLGVNPQGASVTVAARLTAMTTATTAAQTAADDAQSAADAAQSTADDAATAAADAQTAADAAQSDVDDLNTALGTPTGSALALVLSQISAEATDELVAGTDPGEVDDSAVAGYVKFNVDGTDYAFPVYAIVPAV